MSYLTVKQSLFASFAFAVGLLLLALVKRPCPPSALPLAPALETDLETNLDTDADASGDLYGEYYR